MARKNIKGSVGIDIAEAVRFINLMKVSQWHLLKKFFTEKEIAYCLNFKDSAIHFAGQLAAKEAASKALGVEKFPFAELEIRHKQNGQPEVWKGGKKLPVSISISHTKELAIAIALA